MTLERLGESSGFGYTLLELLGVNGWEIAVTKPFAGAQLDAEGEPIESDHAGVLVIASKSGYEIRRTGESVAAVACDVFNEAAHMQRVLPIGDA